MFAPSSSARLFTVPVGASFSESFVKGLLERASDTGQAIEKIEIFLNTRRLKTALEAEFVRCSSGAMPRLRILADLTADPVLTTGRAPSTALQRQLDLTMLIQGLLDAQPELAPESALMPLCQSLDALISELYSEGVSHEALSALDVSDESGHWQRALEFFKIAAGFAETEVNQDNPERLLREAVMVLRECWAEAPPCHPVLLVGTTASRGSTALLAQTIASLPQGAVVFPGSDPFMPRSVWDRLKDPLAAADHPQHRLAVLADKLELDPTSLEPWSETNLPIERAARSQLLSLALRPAPVTDSWREEGRKLQDLDVATRDVTLIEAPSPRIEAEALALGLRQAAEDGKRAVLISPDRNLTRQVSAALQRWNIIPDDSAGTPLHHTPPGRLVAQASELLMEGVSSERLLRLLKHPLVVGPTERGEHLLCTRELEIYLRRAGPPVPNAQVLDVWAKQNPGHGVWSEWVKSLLCEPVLQRRSVSELLSRHQALLSSLAIGAPEAPWKGDAGASCQQSLEDLQTHADRAAPLHMRDYHRLIVQLLQSQESREAQQAHPNILIWGALESRYVDADLVILGGLNDGVWPGVPSADPWLNRRMRAQAGLLLPERQIGLSAHDFQQAMGAPEVWISRALRNDEAETVPSRWINRLTNLLGGLHHGRPALEQMRARGQVWIGLAEGLDRPQVDLEPAFRPSPRVPPELRPTDFRITDISQLLRDPYAIYARDVLRLRALNPLVSDADARHRGIAVHSVMERFTQEVDPSKEDAAAQLLSIAAQVMGEACPWPVVRLVWLASLERFAQDLVRGEAIRRNGVTRSFVETTGVLAGGSYTLRGRADRIDVREDGMAVLYDYKTGAPPTRKQQLALDKQLLIEAAMVERGAFEEVGARPVRAAKYLQVGTKLGEVAAPIEEQPTDKIMADLAAFFTAWTSPEQGYTARIAALSSAFGGAYDQLARFGEWDDSAEPRGEDLKYAK